MVISKNDCTCVCGELLIALRERELLARGDVHDFMAQVIVICLFGIVLFCNDPLVVSLLVRVRE